MEEIVRKNGSVVTDYQYDQNIHTDSHFLQDTLSQMERADEEIILVTDGGYDGQDNVELAKEKNVTLVTTALIGKEAPDALTEFVFNEDGTCLIRCAAGHEPRSQSYTKVQTNAVFLLIGIIVSDACIRNSAALKFIKR